MLLEPGLLRLVAPNPSPMTADGTNTYLLGQRDIVVIDPGPANLSHLQAILAALPEGARVQAILVSHAHLDHSALAPELGRRTGAPVLAFGPAGAGLAPRPGLALGQIGGGEGVDAGFVPDRLLGDGDSLLHEGAPLTAHHTPGHMGNHLCFGWRGALFTGDHVMGWASSLISPPEGDVAQYRASLTRLQDLAARRFFPGHGAPVEDPAARIAFLLRHRAVREAAVLASLSPAFEPLELLLHRAYADVPAAMHGAALRNMLAHLIDLESRNLVQADRPIAPDARFRRTDLPD